MSRKLDCKFRNSLNAYLDNELGKEQFDLVKVHLLSCSVCQNEIRELNSLNALLASYDEKEVPDFLKEKILSELEDFPNSRIFRKNRLVNFMIAASIAASFLIGLIFSTITFTDQADTLSEFSLGQESLYSYYNGVE